MFGHWRAATFTAVDATPNPGALSSSIPISAISRSLANRVASLIVALPISSANGSPPLPLADITASINPLVEAAVRFNGKLKSGSILHEYRVCGLADVPPSEDTDTLFAIALGLKVSEAKGDGSVPTEEWVSEVVTGPEPEFYV